MSEETAPEVLVMRHLADIESAYVFIDDVLEPKFWREMGHRVEDWSSDQGWDGFFDPTSDKDFWIAPRAWQSEDARAGAFDFKFALELIAGEDGTNASSLCTFVGTSARGDRQAFSFNPKLLGARAWKALLNRSETQLQQLRELGFEIDTRKGTISYPVSLDPTLLGQAFVDDEFDIALEPLTKALAQINAAMLIFDQLVAAARAEAG